MVMRVKRQRLSIVLLAAAVCGAPALAQQPLRQTPGSHVTVTECSPHRHRVGTPGHSWIDPYGIYHPPGANFPYSVGFLGVTYTNDAPIAAKEIDFGLVSRGHLIAVSNDVGTFSHGVKIAHEFSLDPEVFPIGTAFPYCAVLRVKYADGREWRNPNPPVS